MDTYEKLKQRYMLLLNYKSPQQFRTIYYALQGVIHREPETCLYGKESSVNDSTIQPTHRMLIAITIDEWKTADTIYFYRKNHKNKQNNPIKEVEESNLFLRECNNLANELQKHVNMDTRITYEQIRKIRYSLAEGRTLSTEEIIAKENDLINKIKHAMRSRLGLLKQKEFDMLVEKEARRRINIKKYDKDQERFEEAVEAKIKSLEK